MTERRSFDEPEQLQRQLEIFTDDLVVALGERTEAVRQLRESRNAFALQFALVVESHDPDTRRHLDNTERLAAGMARRLEITGDELDDLKLGFMLHDVGKFYVPGEIIRKPGPLSDEEWVIMRTHPAAGAQMLTGFIPSGALDVVRCHHERWDGKGYPRGLSGTDIPLPARIFTIADVFDALNSNRPYRATMQPEEALEIIRAGRGSQFDPEVVDVFLEYIERHLDTSV